MLGHGRIYEAYASGEISDDDEVAVVHGPAETGFMPLTDAMVDIRDAIDEAKALGVLTPAAAKAVIECAKAQHFKERNLKKAVRSILQQSHSNLQIDEILAWFAARPAGAKERDARDLLANLDFISEKARSFARAAPRFIPTVYLRRLEVFGYRS